MAWIDDLCRQEVRLVGSGQHLTQPFGFARARDDKGYIGGGVDDRRGEGDAPRVEFLNEMGYHPARLFPDRAPADRYPGLVALSKRAEALPEFQACPID